jgi:transposase
VPREDSTGGKQKLGPISKQGDRYLRRILVVGARAVLKRARLQPEKYSWLTQLLARKPFRVVAVVKLPVAWNQSARRRRTRLGYLSSSHCSGALNLSLAPPF